MVKEQIRTFVCIDFPDEVVKEVARLQELLGKIKFTGKVTELENLHLTLKFLGGVEEEKLERIKTELGKIKIESFEVKLGEVGTFSYRGKPRIVWVKVNGKEMYELQKKIDDVLEKEGFRKEERFMSHLTVARIKYVKDVKGFSEYVKNLNVKPLKFNVGEFKLMKSELDKMGLRYELIGEFRLNN